MLKVRLTLALAALLAAPAGAQVTTFVPPGAPRLDSAAVAAATTDSIVRKDSVAQAQVANMKAWVDSAAGDIVVARGDSAGLTAGSAPETFRNGSRAPETASPLPLMAAAGLGAMGAGLLLRRRRQRAEARIQRPARAGS